MDSRPKQDVKLVESGFPILDRHAPFLTEIPEAEVEQFDQGFVIGEAAPNLDQSSEAHVDRLDGIGGVDDFPDFRWKVEERDQPAPITPPGLTDGGDSPDPTSPRTHRASAQPLQRWRIGKSA